MADRKAKTLTIHVDGRKNASAVGVGASISLVNEGDVFVGGTPEGRHLDGMLEFLRLTHGTLADADTTIEELYAWEFDCPFLRDFTGRKPAGGGGTQVPLRRVIECPSGSLTDANDAASHGRRNGETRSESVNSEDHDSQLPSEVGTCEGFAMRHWLCARLLWAVVFGRLCSMEEPIVSAADGKPLGDQPALAFQHEVVDEQPPRNPWTKLAGDFNGDGKLDIAIAGQNGPLVWYANPGWQKFQVAERGWRTVGGAVGDVDGDGDVDIIPGAQVWFENPLPKGDPATDAWRPHRISDIGTHDVALVDFDRDGRHDLVARDQSSFGTKTGNQLHFWGEEGPDQWRHHAVECPHGEGLAVGDLDRDGDIDVVIGGRWFENDGHVNGAWLQHAFTTNWTWAHTKVALGDLNRDGLTDIVLAPAELQGQRYRLTWYAAPRASVQPNWQEHMVDTPIEAVMHALAVVDMDGDGQQDIVTARMHQGSPPQEVSVFRNLGKGSGWQKVVVSERGSHDVLVADFNGDGRPDILGANHGGPPHPVELWLSQVPKRAGTGPLRVPQTNPRSSNIKEWDLANPTNLVRLNGKSLCDDAGPFLGLGVSYFQALRHAKYDRARLDRNLALFAAKGFNYVRILSMVSWDGIEIAPVTFTNRAGRVVAAWPDYWSQFRDLLDVVAQHGLRAEVTIFADAQIVMPSKAARQTHLDGILAAIAGREGHVLHLEVANEAWQNGFPGVQGIAALREFTQYLADRTSLLVSITSNDDTSDHGISALYRSSAADLATVHFSRDTRTIEGGWLPVRDVYRAGNLPGVPPVSSNEPIGPGSSVSSESDPVKLCAAAVFAYLANLPAYVFHCSAGVYARDRFEDTAGIGAFQFIRRILPPDLASWARHDGIETSAPFTVFCDGQPNRYWTDVRRATNGCHRNIGSLKGNEFVSFPMGILAGGVTLEARRSLQFQVIHPLTGVVATNLTLNGGARFTLPPGPGAYVLKGTVLPNSQAQPAGAKGDGDERVVGAETQSAASFGPPIPSWFPRAPPLPPPKGNVIRVATVDELLASIDRVGPDETILLADGRYLLPRVIVLQQKKNITLRSASGDPTRVILSSRGWDSHAKGDDLLHIGHCEGVTIADLTFTDCRSYGIKVEAENAPKDIQIYNCHFRDIGVRAIKGSAGQDPNIRAVRGSVRYCSFENTKVPPADWLFGGDYISAIDMMALEDWTFSDSLFRNINGRNGGGRAAIFIWVRSRRVVVERNLILDCDRGVSFGNPGQSTANLAGERLAYVTDGVIRNNFIAGGADCGIELWHADRIKVFHNTIWRPEQNWSRGIRVGTGTAHTDIVNNLVHGEIRLEGGEAQFRGNLAGRLDGYFAAPESGNLALTPAATGAIDQGVLLPEVTDDIRGRPRSNLPDVGAWEFGPRLNQ